MALIEIDGLPNLKHDGSFHGEPSNSQMDYIPIIYSIDLYHIIIIITITINVVHDG